MQVVLRRAVCVEERESKWSEVNVGRWVWSAEGRALDRNRCEGPKARTWREVIS